MKIEFRPLAREEVREAVAGELHVRPLNPRYDAALACGALELGVEGFVQGALPIRTIVVRTEPTLDDMLALLVLQELLAGRTEVCRGAHLAQYAANLRQGYRPDSRAIPLEDSPAAVFRALYDIEVPDSKPEGLKDEKTKERFLARWERMAKLLRPAMAANIDPRAEPILTRDQTFDNERAFLREDEKKYREDIQNNGRRFWIRLPDEKERVPGLMLRCPRSTLFKDHARGDKLARGGDGYKFLAVKFGNGGWKFSTDPAENRRISSLEKPLQHAESTCAGYVPAHPWYDGEADHHGTMVASPWGHPTLLSDDQVSSIMWKWGDCRRIWSVSSRQIQFGLMGILALGLAALLIDRIIHKPIPPHDDNLYSLCPYEVDNSQTLSPNLYWEVLSEAFPGTQKFSLPNNERLPKHFLLRFHFYPSPDNPSPCEGLTVAMPECDSMQLPVEKLNGQWSTKVVAITVPPKSTRQLEVTPQKPRADGAIQKLQMSWAKKLEEQHLFIATMGSSGHSSGDLKFADQDAHAISDALQRQKGRPFDEIHPVADLEKATGDDIADAVAKLPRQLGRWETASDTVRKRTVIIYLSGHGVQTPPPPANSEFAFLPADSSTNASRKNVRVSELIQPLVGIDCTTILIIDCCHAGQAVKDLMKLPRLSDLFVLAACSADEDALEPREENPSSPHSYLTTPLLEILNGDAIFMKQRSANGGPVTLKETIDYCEKRVADLVRAGKKDPNLKLQQTPSLHSISGNQPQDVIFCRP
jgi:hypothetical protein